MTGDCHVRFRERLKGRFLGSTRPKFEVASMSALENLVGVFKGGLSVSYWPNFSQANGEFHPKVVLPDFFPLVDLRSIFRQILAMIYP